MHTPAPEPPNGRTSISSTVITILITLAAVGAVWLFFNEDTVRAVLPAAEASAPTSVQPWPTAPATFTPVATAPAVLIPTPTPIQLPAPRLLGELAVVEFTLSSNQTTGGPDKNVLKRILGKDEVTLRAVGRVRVSMALDAIERDLTIQPDGRTIVVRLPKLTVSSVELIPEQSTFEAQQRWLLSEYAGLELQAMGLARNDMYRQVAESDEMMGLATEVARLRVIEHLRNLGFTDITVTSAAQ